MATEWVGQCVEFAQYMAQYSIGVQLSAAYQRIPHPDPNLTHPPRAYPSRTQSESRLSHLTLELSGSSDHDSMSRDHNPGHSSQPQLELELPSPVLTHELTPNSNPTRGPIRLQLELKPELPPTLRIGSRLQARAQVSSSCNQVRSQPTP
jgi:hypothetical protein